jgi:hypothetical protein
VSVTIAGIECDRVDHYAEGDVLYLWAGEPRNPAHDDAFTIVNARRIFEREGKIPITLPEHQIEATNLGDVLAAA